MREPLVSPPPPAVPSVFLLDLHARADGFVAGDTFDALATRLEAAGHPVARARLVASEAPDPAAFLVAIESATTASHADVVVLARAWDRALVEAARRARPAAKLVRLTSGVRAAIDDAFDHVLDPAGLFALLAGDPSPRAADYQRTTAADLRRRLAMAEPGTGEPAPGRPVYARPEDAYTSSPSAAPGDVYTSSPSAAPGASENVYTAPPDVYTPRPRTLTSAPVAASGRPTISGPSSGCPFLLDARSSPAFAGLDLDPELIQTKGCTFCLDNSGAYVVPKQADVLAAWLGGVRRIRAETSGVHRTPPSPGASPPPAARLEILLTDERPHPFLPAFFEAIAAEPGLGPIELLWKSRADWLLEHAADVERACEIAGRSGSVVHLYLVGFESFDRGHLDLFNKGHGPELNEAAIVKMRELQERFPRSFEHRRLRSHGIVLFTPWTEPEALLENARWMRRLRFHELRSEAVKTRLRLYPRVPLHHKAERDGLLTERFEEGRGDRAAEQGYDASAPWRFRDPRTEAIFQLANALHELDRGVTDADLIELATRFVLRWPGLASAPSLAHLPVRAAIEAWGAPLALLLDALGPAATAFDPEIEAIGVTSKVASLKESVRGADAEDMARAYRAMGFAAEVVLRHAMEKTTGAHSSGRDHAVVCVARDDATLAATLSAQRSLADSRGAAQIAAVRELGAHMGYPDCCVTAFSELADRGDNLANERAPFLCAHDPTFLSAPPVRAVTTPSAPSARSEATAPHPVPGPDAADALHVQHPPPGSLHPLLHRTGAVRLIAHHLCSPGCAASVAEAERLLDRLRASDPDAPDHLLALLRTPSLFLDYDRFASIEGAWSGDTFVIARVLRTGRATAFEALLATASSVKLAPEGITLDLRGDGEHSVRTVPAAQPLLVVPGEPIAPAALAALQRPAASASSSRQRSADVRGPRPPDLPAALRPGLRAAGYSIAAIDRTETGHTVWLAGRAGERVAVRLRAHAEGTPYTLRKGRWAVDLDDPRALPEPARAAIGLLVRALPQW